MCFFLQKDFFFSVVFLWRCFFSHSHVFFYLLIFPLLSFFSSLPLKRCDSKSSNIYFFRLVAYIFPSCHLAWHTATSEDVELILALDLELSVSHFSFDGSYNFVPNLGDYKDFSKYGYRRSWVKEWVPVNSTNYCFDSSWYMTQKQKITRKLQNVKSAISGHHEQFKWTKINN